MKRRQFLGTVGVGAVLGLSGCLGYTRTSPSDFELVESGYTDGIAWVDVRYSGEQEGKIQYKLYISDGGSFVKESRTESVMVSPGRQYRVRAKIDDVVFDRDTASVGLRIINTEDTEAEGDVGKLPISQS